MNVTKFDLCGRVSKRFNKPAAELKPIFEAFLDEIMNALSEGQKIELRGFGGFKTATRRARLGRNPRTGESVQIPSYTALLFKFSKEAQRTFERKQNEIELRRKNLLKRKKKPRKISQAA